MTSLCTHRRCCLLVTSAKQWLERHALSGGKQDHKTAFLLPPETRYYTRGKKSSQRIQEIDDIHNESECSGLKL